MATPQEVEIKFLVPDLKALEKMLKASGFKLETPSTHEMNTLYDLPGQKLRRRGEILRLRKYGQKWKLTHKSKGKVGRHKSRDEAETALSDGGQMNAILRAVGFAPVFTYEKFRSEWTDGQGQVVLDHTPIGDVAEIEGKSGWIDGNPGQMLIQLEGIAFTVVYCSIASFVILKVLDVVMGLRVEEEVERDGLDLALHGETVQ